MPKVTAAFEFKIRLIELVQRHPWLHNKHHPDHKKKETRLMSWEEIGHELGTTGDSCCDLWRKLCNHYSSCKSRCGRDGGVPTWPLYHYMAGMIGGDPGLSVMKAPTKAGSDSSEQNLPDPDLQNTTQVAVSVHDIAPPSAPFHGRVRTSRKSSPSSASVSQTRRRQPAPVNTEAETAIQTESNSSVDELSSVIKQLVAVIEQVQGMQENEHFGRYVAATLSTMSPDRCAQAKSEIQRMLTE